MDDERAANGREEKRRQRGSHRVTNSNSMKGVREIFWSFPHAKGPSPLPDRGDCAAKELPEGGGTSHASRFTVSHRSLYKTGRA